ncbi:hypothetical protein SDC9_127229 [bioreactor metagenome]|uniref:Uncharacterized protein n=1 Tax=bioreactor metagenome TaxID=1076179 RepID=A0A645CU11_9ZZZZ
MVGGDGRDNDRIQFLGRHARDLQRAAGGPLRQIGTGHFRRGDVTFANSRAGADPFVIGFDHLFQIHVGQNFFRNIGTGALDFNSHLNPLSALSVAACRSAKPPNIHPIKTCWPPSRTSCAARFPIYSCGCSA